MWRGRERRRVCGPGVSWDWLVLDISYVLVLVGGSLVLRARTAGLPVWLAFGGLSACVGGLLFYVTWSVQGAAAAAAPVDAMGLMASC